LGVERGTLAHVTEAVFRSTGAGILFVHVGGTLAVVASAMFR